MIQYHVEANLAGLDALADALEREVDKAVRKATFFAEAQTKRNAPIDIGFLRASTFSVTSKSNGQAQALAASKSLHPGRNFILGAPSIAKPLEGFVITAAEYARPVELGHLTRSGSFVPGQFFQAKAAEETKPVFRRLVSEAIKKAGGEADKIKFA